MTDEAWAKGMHDLVMLPDREMSQEYAADRGEVYRRVLDHLTDAEWLYAVAEALKYERWFPAPATLISFADEYVPPGLALPAGRTSEQIEADRIAARENLRGGAALIRGELQRRGLLASDAPEPVESMPKASA